MRLTASQLKQIIQEELRESSVNEGITQDLKSRLLAARIGAPDSAAMYMTKLARRNGLDAVMRAVDTVVRKNPGLRGAPRRLAAAVEEEL